MPNWCQNNLVVTGDPKMLDVIQELEFDFEKIIPQPQDLVDDVAPYCAKCKKPYIALNDDPKIERVRRETCKECNISENIGGRLGSTMFDKNEDIFKQLNKEETELAKIWIKKHGTASWYEWNCNAWYTKWNRSNLSIKRENDTTLLGYFATAWGPPYPIFEELCKKFDVIIMLEWEIELGNGKGITRITKDGINEISSGESENYMNLSSPSNKYDWSKTS